MKHPLVTFIIFAIFEIIYKLMVFDCDDEKPTLKFFSPSTE